MLRRMLRRVIPLLLLLSPFLMGDVAPVGSSCTCGGGGSDADDDVDQPS
jgi:hypothetical protein